MGSTWENRFAEFVRRLTGARETTSLEVIRDLMPVLPVADPAAVECLMSRDEKLVSHSTARTAAAGQLPTISVINDTAGMLFCIDWVMVWCSTGVVELMAELTTTTAIGVGGAWVRGDATTREFCDRRFKTTSEEPASAIGQLDQAGSIAATEVCHLIIPQNNPVHIPWRGVLVNGTGLRVQAQTAASRIGLVVQGRERFAELAERQ